REALHQASAADVVVKASGVGAHDALLEAEVADLGRKGCRTIFWDVDAPATLRAMAQGGHRELREALPRYDAVLTYGGGPRVVAEYTQRGARSCTPVYNALDPATHHAADPDPAYRGDLAFLGNRLPDREARVKEFFLDVARDMPERGFVLGGAGWEPHQMTPNVRYVGHVGTRAHNAFNSTPTAVLNVNRASMAEYGHSPPTRIFEAAGAGACIITDAWPGVEEFFEPGREILVAGSGEAVARLLRALDPAKARAIGAAARRRALREHTYTQRALQVDAKLRALCQEVVA
ncbi:MAG TPA: glycosyltransferase, partial [Candidatus Thermoplasmatota archaeon]|nr:glycosyltransferase [Candidatus Thermoplasmatota archaeon]